MMRHFCLSLTICLALCSGAVSCSKPVVEEPDDPTPIVPENPLEFEPDVEYAYDDTEFNNPERGMYITNCYYFQHGDKDDYTPMTAAQIKSRQKTYGYEMTLTFSQFYIDNFRDSEFSQEFLDCVRTHLLNHREAGLKTIVRFCYGYQHDGVNYFDEEPTEEVVLKQIAQLKPIFYECEDIIYVLQAGFIGLWGEWHTMPNFSTKESQARVVNALLEALPESRMIQLRTPTNKMNALGYANVRDTLTREQAFTNIPKARVGSHNDCFLANSNDAGTYADGSARKLWRMETQYTIMGGETCIPDPTYCNCSYGVEEMEKYHWSYLNSAYNVNVLNLFEEGGCFTDIRKRLGYRLSLDKAKFDGEWKAGEPMDLCFSVTNRGFASIMNPRIVEFVIEPEGNTSDKQIIRVDTDPRFWQGGQTSYWEERINLPNTLKSGTKYNLYLNLPDPSDNLYANPAFSIRLANKKVWDAKQGYNLIYTFTAE